jgi:hypothetical protein
VSKIALTLSILGCFSSFCWGQAATATLNALQRTFMIETTKGRATTFSIDVDNREYWITAKHVFTGVKSGPPGVFTVKTVKANILSSVGNGDEGQNQHWTMAQFTTIDPGKDIDIIVPVPDHLLLNYPRDFNLQADILNMVVGGECEFLGFPYGGGWRSKWSSTGEWIWWPYIKHCTISGEIQNNGYSVLVLDGINNEGFSGGPVLFGTGPAQRVFAVISGFHQEPLEVIPAPLPGQDSPSSVPPAPELPGEQPGNAPKQIVEANSGFILAYDITPAIKAIRADPIGPLRPEAPPNQVSK